MNFATTTSPASSKLPEAQVHRRYLGLLRQGIEVAQTGDIGRARSLLREAIGLYDQEEMAWIWLASVAENQTETYVCMEQVLEINAKNKQARQWVQQARELGIPSPTRKPIRETQPMRKPENDRQDELFAADETVFLGTAADLFGDSDS